MDVLTEFLAGLDTSDPEAVANAIRSRFTVTDREQKPQPTPMVGQVWRNRTSGRLVRVERFRNRIVEWTALSGRGPSKGFPDYTYWPSRYEFVADSEAEL